MPTGWWTLSQTVLWKRNREAEERFEEILTQNIKYGKNDLTLQRYLGYHREIQSLVG